nr:copper chaperone PCu(A)C [Streptomyces sp. CBMA29]
MATGAGVALSDGSSGTSGQGGGLGKVSVSGGYIPQPLLTDEAAAYVTVKNTGGGDAELTAVSTPLAAHVTLHSTTGTTMRQVTALTVPAGGTLTLGTGGDHMMLENLTHKPRVGETVTLRLHFAHATPATVTVTVPVEATTYRPDPKG